MGFGFFLVRTIEDGSILATLAAQNCDIGVVGYEMARLVKQVGELLTPAVRAELQASLPSPAPHSMGAPHHGARQPAMRGGRR
jgi:hypothetical protein